MHVYILYSSSLKKHYVGHTQNIDERLIRHNSGREKYTKKGSPWSLVWSFKTKDRSEAMKLERKIKKRGASRFLNEYGV